MVMRKRYQEQLEFLHSEMIEMGALCEEAISNAAKCFYDNNRDYVKEKEVLIDRKEKDIEALCIKLILHQQPVAGDLRVISSALKMISDMERIGDQACDIAEILEYVKREKISSETHIMDMARETIAMVTDSIEAFVKGDMDLSQDVIRHDDIVDALFDKVKSELIEKLKNNTEDATIFLDTLMIAKYFERIGDHAVNIAEWVMYSITGTHVNENNSVDL